MCELYNLLSEFCNYPEPGAVYLCRQCEQCEFMLLYLFFRNTEYWLPEMFESRIPRRTSAKKRKCSDQLLEVLKEYS